VNQSLSYLRRSEAKHVIFSEVKKRLCYFLISKPTPLLFPQKWIKASLIYAEVKQSMLFSQNWNNASVIFSEVNQRLFYFLRSESKPLLFSQKWNNDSVILSEGNQRLCYFLRNETAPLLFYQIEATPLFFSQN